MIFEIILQHLNNINIFNFFEHLQYCSIDLNEITNILKFTNKTIGTVVTVEKRRMFQYTVFTQPVLMFLNVDSFEAQIYIRYMHTLYHVNPAEIFLDVETGLVIIGNPSYFHDPTHWWAGETYDYLYWAHSHLPSYLDRDWFDEDGWYCSHWIKHSAHEAVVDLINTDWTKYTWKGSRFQYILQFPDIDFRPFDFKFKYPRGYIKLMQEGVIPPLKTKLWWEVNYNFPPIPKPLEYEFDYSDDYSEYFVEEGRLARFINYIKGCIKDWIDDLVYKVKCWWTDLWDRIEKHFRVKNGDDD